MLARERTQRDVMRELLGKYGYNKHRVLFAYAAADKSGYAPRASNMNKMSPMQYAEEVWADGHRPRAPWILTFCKQHGIKAPHV
jgi:hypothetical protein